MRWAPGALALVLLPAAALAQQVVTSNRPDGVSVTVYRAPDRGSGEAINLGWPGGYALITETRQVTVPAGVSIVRFEGVAEGIIPVSAIVSGLPGGVIEKNREGLLLSPAALIDGTLGRRVHLKRTDRATGKVTEEDAVVLAGPAGGVVLRTDSGIEALGCSGLAETLGYSSVPAGLSAKPTLAVTTHSDRSAMVTVTLSYLADAFDWQADYVAEMGADGHTLDLFAWLTLANGNAESFVAARVQAIAGKPNREDEEEQGIALPQLQLSCWPRGDTSSAPYAAPQEISSDDSNYGADIVVTAMRRSELRMASPVAVMTATQEDLGDLKLYRIPEVVTVASNAQKQVALLVKKRVPAVRSYQADLSLGGEAEDQPVHILLRMTNVKERGLGLPLPSGGVALFETAGGRPMLVGESRIEDRAIGEDVELVVGEAFDVRVAQHLVETTKKDAAREDDDRPLTYEVELSNARSSAAEVEVLLRRYNMSRRLTNPSQKLGTKDGRIMWRARVPANGRAVLRYVLMPESGNKADETE